MSMDQEVRELDNVFCGVVESMWDMDDVLRHCLVALCTDGHVLLEGNPGLGKTSLVKKLAGQLGLPWRRIQFTPDLMPADITGTQMPKFGADGNLSNVSFAFSPGPIFTSLLLADEINRASPKTQSAMLEAMAERQVTVLGETHKIESPFMVLATQNPIDYEGTYELPKAQTDRFMMKLFMPSPSETALINIMQKDAGPEAVTNPHNSSAPTRKEMVKRLRENIRNQIPREQDYVDDNVRKHITAIVLASNGQSSNGNLNTKGKGLFEYGFGPRAATALLLGATAWVYLFPHLNDGVEHADGASLAEVFLPILRHRTVLKMDVVYGAKENTYKATDKLLIEFCTECARDLDSGYRKSFESGLKKYHTPRS
jgi:MoxR-like ATPase